MALKTPPSTRKNIIGRICFALFLIWSFFQLTSLETVSKTTTAPDKQQAITIPNSNLYSVRIIHGQRRTISGANRSYVLYIPKSNPKLPKQPYPLVVMVHGFLMSSNQQANTDLFLAQRGFVVLAPNMTKVLLGNQNRTNNIKDVVDQTKWLIEQSKIKTSPYYDLVDAKRTAIAGNSSGGAVCFECALEAQRLGMPFHTLCSLEGVPWDRTLSEVSNLKPMQLLTLRAESCLCNYHWNVLKYTELLNFATDDVKVNGAHHCDAENPTTIGCMSVCGTSHEKYRHLFQLITYLYLRDTLAAPRLFETTKSFIEVANDMQEDGKVIAHLDNLKSSIISKAGSHIKEATND